MRVAHEPATSDELATVFARMSGLLLSEETVGSVLRLIATLAREVFPECRGAGLSVLDPDGERITKAATGELVERADRIQYEMKAGPCLTAWAQRTVVRIDDLATDTRWPAWSRQTAELGLRSVMSAPMVAGDVAVGAMKIYAGQPGVYGPREESLLAMFATQAAVLVANAKSYADTSRVSTALQASLRDRDVVNLAKGILMGQGRVDEQTAFLQLADTARQRRRSVREVAEETSRATARRLR